MKNILLIEIKSGIGGVEAELFSEEIFQMYLKYIRKEKLSANILYYDKGDILFEVSGKKELLDILYSEKGIHKVQRVSVTSKKNKMHTSTISVAAFFVKERETVSINLKEVEIKSCKASGAGGQYVNTTDSAVKVKHIPTGITVSCQNERSQFQNKMKALNILEEKIKERQNKTIINQKNNSRKEQVLNSERSEARRVYNFPRNEVSDFITGKTSTLKNILKKANLNELK